MAGTLLHRNRRTHPNPLTHTMNGSPRVWCTGVCIKPRALHHSATHESRAAGSAIAGALPPLMRSSVSSANCQCGVCGLKNGTAKPRARSLSSRRATGDRWPVVRRRRFYALRWGWHGGSSQRGSSTSTGDSADYLISPIAANKRRIAASRLVSSPGPILLDGIRMTRSDCVGV